MLPLQLGIVLILVVQSFSAHYQHNHQKHHLSSDITPANHISSLGAHQVETNLLLNTLGGGRWRKPNPYEYDRNFRPPSPSSSDSSEPTIVKISLKQISYEEFNDAESEAILRMAATLLKRYNDSRLQFTPPPGYKHNFVLVRPDVDFEYPLIWKPNIETNQGGIQTYRDHCIISTNGEVDTESSAYLGPKCIARKDKNDTESRVFLCKIKLWEAKHSIEDVVLEWDDEEQLFGNEEEERFVHSTSGHRYKVIPTFGTGKKSQKFGHFRKMEYSLATLKMMLVREDEQDNRIDEVD